MATKQLGPYKIGRTLGIGTFSKVKMAIHEPSNTKVAIKILNRRKLAHMDMGLKLNREIDILSSINHPHVIRLYEVIETDSDIYVVIEYSPNGELFDYIVSKGRLEEAEARRFLQQIICGVEYCHSHMFVHRDLKPENLLLDEQNNIKIADFGLSNLLEDGIFLKTSCGSPNYAAPEVISGDLYAGPEVDIWSCGVILYALLCGNLPFDDDNIPSLFRKIKSGLQSLPSYLSPDAKNLISSMLQVDPVKRISIQSIKNHPFFKKNLPLYLHLSMDDTILRNAMIDDEIMTQLAQFGFDRNEALEGIALCPELLIKWNYPDRERLRQVAVFYNLLLDTKRKEEQLRLKKGVDKANLFDMIEDQVHVEKMHFTFPPETKNLQQLVYGLCISGPPSNVMGYIFQALISMDMKYKILSPYRIHVRKGGIAFILQLYMSRRSNYSIDIHQLAGPLFSFFSDMAALQTYLCEGNMDVCCLESKTAESPWTESFFALDS